MLIGFAVPEWLICLQTRNFTSLQSHSGLKPAYAADSSAEEPFLAGKVSAVVTSRFSGVFQARETSN